MIDTLFHIQKDQSVTLDQYMSELKRIGKKIRCGSQGTIWIAHERGALVRLPTFNLTQPTQQEINSLFWKDRAACISYILDPDKDHPANAWLYICSDREYGLSKLGKGTRSSINRGLKELRITQLAGKELLRYGIQAYCDTRTRVGLTDGTAEVFEKRFIERTKYQGNVFVGAWKDDQLAAFFSMTEIGDGVEIDGSFSMNAFRKYYPNDTLMFQVLTNYLVDRKKSLVSYGSSSIQTESNEFGLHAFKTKIGFEAKPVHRVFLIHPLIRPFTNNLMRLGVNMGLYWLPDNRLLKKADGMLALIGGKKPCPEAFAKKWGGSSHENSD
jgi:hypothetical protein